jgi:Leucine-rich repeat (LRR) protein
MVNPISSSSVNSKGTLPETNKDPFNEKIKSQVEKIKSETSQGADVKSYKLLSDQKNGLDYLKAAKIIYSIFPHLDQKKKIKIDLSDGEIEISQDVFEALKKDSITIRDMTDDAQGEIAFILINKKTFEELLKKLYSPDSASNEIDIELIKCASYLDCKKLLENLKNQIIETANSLRPEDLEKAFTLNKALQTLPPPLFNDIIDENLSNYFGKILLEAEDPEALIQKFEKEKVSVLTFKSNLSVAVLNGIKKLSGLQKLSLLNISNLSEDSLKNLPSSIKVLTIYSSQIIDTQLVHLRSLPLLRNLSLHGSTLTDAGLENLSTLTSLITLNLSGTNITGLTHLSSLTSLKTLILSGTEITDEGLRPVSSLTSLTTLNLSGTQITDAGLAPISSLTLLTTLDLSRNQITDAGLTHLHSLSSLMTLNLFYTQITDEGITNLRSLNTLTSLNLNRTQITDTGIVQLFPLTSLTTLNLSNTPITDKGLIQLASMTSLTHLELRGIKITSAGAAGLGRMTSLIELRLHRNQLIDEEITNLRLLPSLNLYLDE